MKKYIDIKNQDSSIGIIGIDGEGKAIELIQAGTTINSMPTKYKYQYLNIEERNKIFFIFDDYIPQIDFYSVPRIDIFALDNNDGYFGTVGATSDIEDLESSICYIDKDKNIYKVGNNMREFIFSIGNMEERLKSMEPLSGIIFFNSFEEAKEQLYFTNIAEY